MSMIHKMHLNIDANGPFDQTVDDLRILQGEIGVIVASGPSLDLEINRLVQDIKENNTFTVCCDASIWDVLEQDVLPDAVITSELDSQHERPGLSSTELLLDGGDLSAYKDTPLIAPTWANRAFIKKWPNDHIFWYRCADDRFSGIIDNVHPDTNIPKVGGVISMVGFHAISLFDYLGVPEIHAYGFDCGVPEGHSHHSKNYVLNKSSAEVEKHFSRMRSSIKQRHGGFLGHGNVINFSPLTKLLPPHFKCSWPYNFETEED